MVLRLPRSDIRGTDLTGDPNFNSQKKSINALPRYITCYL